MPDICTQGNVDDSHRRQLLTDGKLPSLDHPQVTNHIGVSAILITQDNYIVIQPRESEDLHSNVNSLSASVSGAVDWDDYADSQSDLVLKDLDGKKCLYSNEFLKSKTKREFIAPDRAIIRECNEEIAFLPEDLRSVHLLGIAREFRRLGKPEFFYLIDSRRKIGYVEEASAEANYRWEYGGKSLIVTPIPTEPTKRAFFLANRMSDPLYNEITQAAFYFMLRDLVRKNPALNERWGKNFQLSVLESFGIKP